MDIMGGEVGSEESIEELLHLLSREALARLDRGLTGKGHSDPLMLLPSRSSQFTPGGELGDHIAEALLGVEIGVRRGCRMHDDRPSAEGLDLETRLVEDRLEIFDEGVLSWGDRQSVV